MKDEMLLSGLSAGADGGIGTTYNFQPKQILRIYDCFLNGDIAGARVAQTKANDAIEMVLRYGVLPSSKMLINLSGIGYGTCREPFKALSEEAVRELAKMKVE